MPAVNELLTPFVYKVPFEYLSCYISAKQDIAFLNFDNPKRLEVNFKQIFNSAEKAEGEKAIR